MQRETRIHSSLRQAQQETYSNRHLQATNALGLRLTDLFYFCLSICSEVSLHTIYDGIRLLGHLQSAEVHCTACVSQTNRGTHSLTAARNRLWVVAPSMLTGRRRVPMRLQQ